MIDPRRPAVQPLAMRPNAKLTGWAALLLFGLGMLSVLMVYVRGDASLLLEPFAL